jgi:Tol biopolymer transport system component
MSPEQVRGEKLDSRTDLFSFGLILYEMATGQRAFSGDTAGIVHDAIFDRMLVPVRELNPELPVSFEEIIRKALEKDRESRYQTAAEMLAELKSTLKTIKAVPPAASVETSPATGDSSLSKRRRASVPWALRAETFVSGVLLVLLGAISFLWWKFSRPSPALPETMTVRKIDSEKLEYSGQTDGHRATYIALNGNLYFGDFSGHPKSLVYGSTDPEFRKAPQWQVSRDFSVVALTLPKTKTRPMTLAVVKIDGTGYRELLHDNEQGNIMGGDGAFQVVWSWDNRMMLAYNVDWFNPSSKDSCPRLWLVSVADGKRRELVHEESTKCIVTAAFSPDGQFAAFEVLPIMPFPQGATSKVFVVPIRGGEPRLIYESEPWPDNTVPSFALGDWTADGRYLAVKGNHEGKSALFLLPMTRGAASGPPIFVRVGNFEAAWSTLSGALILDDLSSTSADFSWRLASVDPDGKIGKWARIEFSQRLPSSDSRPSFSHDASQIAYAARNLHSTGTDLIVRDLATGRERVVYQSAADNFLCQYSAIRLVVFCTSRIGNEKTDLISVSVDSGAVEKVATFPDPRYQLQCPQDDRIFYFVSDRGNGRDADPKILWDRSSQKETVIANAAELEKYASTLSLDGRWVLRQLSGDLSFRPASGGEWKPLASGVENDLIQGSTPDGNWALYIASDPHGNPGIVFAIPAWPTLTI